MPLTWPPPPHLQEEDPEKYEKHFAAYVGEGIEGDDLEDLYKGVRDPNPTPNPNYHPKPHPNPPPSSCHILATRGVLLAA